MGLINDKVTLLNFDQTYFPQQELQKYADYWLDLNDINHTNYYCEQDSCHSIEQRIKQHANQGITFIGNGNYHYVTYLLLSKMKEPFSLVLFDHHTDMKMDTIFSQLISCGSWVAHAILQLPLLKKVILVGIKHSYTSQIHQGLTSKVVSVPIDLIRKISFDQLTEHILSMIETEAVYISIDKDVMSRNDVMTNWDQGEMELNVLLSLLQQLISHKRVEGMDICGEISLDPLKGLQSAYREVVKRNEKANIRILQTVINN